VNVNGVEAGYQDFNGSRLEKTRQKVLIIYISRQITKDH